MCARATLGAAIEKAEKRQVAALLVKPAKATCYLRSSVKSFPRSSLQLTF